MALEIAKTMQIDGFIIDIGLPDWNGIELAIEIRKTYSYLPIIIERPQGDAQYQVQFYDTMANLASIKKLYVHEKIIEIVNHALNIAQALGSKQLSIRQTGYSMKIDINNIYRRKGNERRHLKINY